MPLIMVTPKTEAGAAMHAYISITWEHGGMSYQALAFDATFLQATVPSGVNVSVKVTKLGFQDSNGTYVNVQSSKDITRTMYADTPGGVE